MRAWAAAALAACLLAAGCGDSSTPVVKGNPDSRHGAEVVDAYARVELLRSLLTAASDAYYAGGSPDDAAEQLTRARAAYDDLAQRVKIEDPVVDREVVARFSEVTRALDDGATPDHERDLIGPLSDQLMDGVAQALVPQEARTDPGVQAEALRRITTRLGATYAAASGPDDPGTRLAFQESWALMRRGQSLASLLGPDLGPERDRIAGAFNTLRTKAFPQGPVRPEPPATSRVDKETLRILEAIQNRFDLSL